MANRRKNKNAFKFLFRMKKKLFALFMIVVLLLIFLIGKIAYIELRSGDKYEKIVLDQQEYSQSTIPFRRGDIVDRKGTVLATSTDVYNIIIDSSVINDKPDQYLEPTMDALEKCFPDSDVDEAKSFVQAHVSNRYYVLEKKLPYEEISAFQKMQEEDSNIKGVWFEKEYLRQYPYGSLAANVIGFTTSGNQGIGGLEDYYNDTLNGTDGRQYGYLNADSMFEINVKDAISGETVVSTIDANLQEIVEDKIRQFNQAMVGDENGAGAEHIGVVMMDPNTGEVLAMAQYPSFDCSNPWNLDNYYTEEEQKEMSDDDQLDALNSIWQNFCLTHTFEPGSTAKPFTVACGLDTGTLDEDMSFLCDGHEEIYDYDIHCANIYGHGTLNMSESLEFSCNDALMQMSYLIGPHNFVNYQQIFNFGLRTNIDLPGEARTDTLIYTEDQMNKINLATNAFGQNFNVTMIQLASAYSALINGGTYYQPHMVCRIEDEDGNTVKKIEPQVLRKTVSSDTAETVREYLERVVDDGTGNTAKVDGYSMCGKTGTAELFDPDTGKRAVGKYLVSFIGSVPAKNPQVVLYVVVDQPNTEDQAHSTYAQNIFREILEESLPYLGIYPDEELDGTNKYLDILGLGVFGQEEETVADIFDSIYDAGQNIVYEEKDEEQLFNDIQTLQEETQYYNQTYGYNYGYTYGYDPNSYYGYQ